MKESEEDRLKCAINESTLSTAARSPFPNGEGKEEAASSQKRKPTPPRCARQCTCQQKLDTKLKKLGIKIEYLYKIQ